MTTLEPLAVTMPKTQVPNEMLKNPALSLFAAPSTAGPITVAAAMRFTPDNTWAIGQYGANRPSELHVAGYSTFGASVDILAGAFRVTTGGSATINGPIYGSSMRLTFGGLDWQNDNLYDVGNSATNRPRTGHFATSVAAPLFSAAEVAAPATPAAGRVSIYAKADHRLYAKDSLGVETDLTFTGTTQAQNDARYLALAGGQMTGTLFTQYIEILSGRLLTFSGQPSDASIANDGTGLRFRYYGQDMLKIADEVIFPPVNYVDLGATTNRFESIFAKHLDLASAGRIVGDFTAASPATRTLIQTATNNAATEVGIIPKGTTTGGAWIETYSASDANNAAQVYLGSTSTVAELGVWHIGAGPSIPLRVNVNGNEVMRFMVASYTSLSAPGGGILLNHNAWYDGAWHRYNTGVAAATLNFDATAGLTFYVAPAGGADPPTFLSKAAISAASVMTLGNLVFDGGSQPGRVGNIRNADFGLSSSTPNWMRISAAQNIAFWANGGGTTADVPQMVLQASDGKLNVTAGIVVTDTWHRVAAGAGGPGFQSGWVDYAGGWEVGYRKDPFGNVWLRGLASGGTLGVVFNLPVGYRPSSHQMYTVVTYMNGVGDVEITTDGNVNMVRVQVGTFNAGWLNLSMAFATT